MVGAASARCSRWSGCVTTCMSPTPCSAWTGAVARAFCARRRTPPAASCATKGCCDGPAAAGAVAPVPGHGLAALASRPVQARRGTHPRTPGPVLPCRAQR
ncbi:hypothetical protein WR25_07149 [Diploscapter pachys]|uniref:Uncharacterized protein n=1 Tax=Diploscapter pachys TaxID=2018661 RepID=A0A2A2M515_9BILA|nr:hypothetical protein WR25_07149 [Diploscapter pachys]